MKAVLKIVMIFFFGTSSKISSYHQMWADLVCGVFMPIKPYFLGCLFRLRTTLALFPSGNPLCAHVQTSIILRTSRFASIPCRLCLPEFCGPRQHLREVVIKRRKSSVQHFYSAIRAATVQ